MSNDRGKLFQLNHFLGNICKIINNEQEKNDIKQIYLTIDVRR